MDEAAAFSELDEIRSMNKLLTQLAHGLDMTLAQFKEALGYATWEKYCRITRNYLTHRFANPEVTPEESREAIKSTIEMTCKLADIIQAKYPDTEPYMRLYRTPIWYVKTLEKDKTVGSEAESV